MGGQGSGRPSREEEQTGRKERIPLGRPRFRLSASKIIPPGMVGRWVNDDPGRLDAAQEGGWRFLADPNAKIGEGAGNEREMLSANVCRRVGTRDGGEKKVGYLMVIDKELYDQDQAEKQQQIDSVEQGLARGEVDGGLRKGDGVYTSEDEIKIQHSKVHRRSA